MKAVLDFSLRALASVRRPLGLILVFAGCAPTAFALGPPNVPEIDPGSMASALTLATGGVLLLTDRMRIRRK
jgi:hypothetical protein